MFVRALIAVVAIVAFAIGAESASATFAGNNGEVVFRSTSAGLYVAHLDGSAPRPLVLRAAGGAPVEPDALIPLSPTWSPDGSTIAFSGFDTAKRERNIYLVDSDGQNLRQLTFSKSLDLSPAWSPDGSQIAFTSNRRDTRRYDLYVMAVLGSDPKPLAEAAADPTWLPDGSGLMFRHSESGCCETYLVALDGSAPVRVPGLSGATGLDWSPDGARIAFARLASGGWHIFTALPDGSGARQLTRPGRVELPGNTDGTVTRFLQAGVADGYNAIPRWSPDGTSIVFSVGIMPGDDINALYLMSADGTGAREFVSETFKPRDFSWRPIMPSTPATPPNVDPQTVPAADSSTTSPRPRKGCTIVGTPGNDILVGTRKRDVICGLGGNDIIRGKGGNDLIKAGPGNDTLIGNRGRDTLKGGPGNDILKGGPGRDRLLGQAGNDRLLAKRGGRDTLNGGPGTDRARFDKAFDRLRKIEAAR